jgi:mono/diheme cytochrome c family protein
LALRFRPILLILPLIGVPMGVPTAHADETGLTEAFLNDPAHIDLGHQLFQRQCTKCHGRGAYPGDAPKLNVKKLSPEDVYLRVTYGFKRMPAWEGVFTEQERMALTAYVKSSEFSN